jgi:hypothetical protein
LTVKTGDGGVQVNVLATGVPTNLIGTRLGASSTDTTVNVGNAGSLAGIAGTLNIENPRWYSAITVDDSADNSAPTVTLSTLGTNPADSESNSDPWGQISGLPGGANINYEYNDTRSLTLKTGGGTTVNVLATGVTTNLVGAGSTTVKLAPDAQMLASLQGPLTLDGGGTGDFTLDDSTDSTGTTYIIDAATVRVGTLPSISYVGLHKLTVNGGTSVDVYNVESTVAGTPVTITGAGFSNTFNVTPTNKELGLLQADLTINPGRVASVILNDQNGAGFAANPGPATYSLSSTVFLPPNSYVLSHGLKVQSSTASGSIYVNGPGATLYGSSLDDTYNVDSTPGPVSLNTGIGHNAVNICPTTQATMLLEGDVTINGVGKTDVVINDQAYFSFGPAVAATYTLSSHLRLFGSQLRQALIVQNTNTSASVIVAGAGSVTLNGLRGNLLNHDDSLKDIYNVESTVAGMPVTLNTGTSNDTVNVTPSSQKLSDLGSDLTIRGTSTAKPTVNIDNSNMPRSLNGQDTYVITSTWTSFNDPVTVNYSNVRAVNLFGAGGTYDVQSTDASAPVTINTGLGLNTVNIGSDPVNLPQSILDPIQGAVTVNGAGNTTLNFNDKGGTPGTAPNQVYNYALAQSTFSRTGTATVTFYGIAAVNLNAANCAGSGFNDLGVFSTAPGTTYNVNAGTGLNEFIVLNISYTINEIQGPLNLHGTGGFIPNDDLVAIYDVDKITRHTLVVNAGDTPQSGKVQRYNADGTQKDAALISYDGINAYAVLYTGESAGHTFNVQSNRPDLLTIIGSGATDTVNVGNSSHTLALIQGNLQIQGSKTSVYVDDSSDASSHTDSRSINLGSDVANSYVVTGLLPSSSATDGRLWLLLDPAAPVTLKTGAGPIVTNDVFKVHDLTNAPALTIDGGNGDNTLDLSSFSKPANLAANSWTINGADRGSVNGLTFASIGNLIGSPDNDTFNFQTGGSLSGKLDGGAGTNTLDYTAFLGDVTVDLPLGSAAAVAKSIAGIQNVNGSQGNDILVGDGNINVLNGGTGRSLIIGGAGADVLTGGAGDSILIGGTTTYSNDVQDLLGLHALQAIMHEFLQTYDASHPLNDFTIRTDNIAKGMGTLAGTNIYLSKRAGNKPATVFGDGEMDKLTSGNAATFAWFLYDSADQVNKKNANDKLTKVD